MRDLTQFPYIPHLVGSYRIAEWSIDTKAECFIMQGAAWIRKQNSSRLGAFLMAKEKEAAEKSRCEAWAIWARLLRDDWWSHAWSGRWWGMIANLKDRNNGWQIEVDFVVTDTWEEQYMLNTSKKAVAVFKCNIKRHNGQVLPEVTELLFHNTNLLVSIMLLFLQHFQLTPNVCLIHQLQSNSLWKGLQLLLLNPRLGSDLFRQILILPQSSFWNRQAWMVAFFCNKNREANSFTWWK